MLRISPTLIVLPSSINAASNNEVGGGKNGGNKTNLSNLSTFKKFTKAGYLIFEDAKKGGNNPNSGGSKIIKGVKAAKSFNYLILDIKKTFNLLQYMFI